MDRCRVSFIIIFFYSRKNTIYWLLILIVIKINYRLIMKGCLPQELIHLYRKPLSEFFSSALFITKKLKKNLLGIKIKFKRDINWLNRTERIHLIFFLVYRLWILSSSFVFSHSCYSKTLKFVLFVEKTQKSTINGFFSYYR